MIKRLIFVVTFSILAVSSISAQVKEINREEFYGPWRSALKLFQDSSHRKTDKNEHYENGVLRSSDEWVYEYIKPDKRRYTSVERTGERLRKYEWIQIDSTRYCRRDDGEWQVSGSCGSGGSGSGGPSDIVSEKYTTEVVKENGKRVTLFEEYTTYRNTYGPEKDRSRLRFWRTKYWLNDKDLLVKEERRTGLLGPEQVSWVNFKQYQYGPVDLKIERPVVAAKQK